MQGTQIYQKILKKKNKVFSNFKLNTQLQLSRHIVLVQGYTYAKQNRIKGPEINPHIHSQLTMFRRMQENEVGSPLHITYNLK